MLGVDCGDERGRVAAKGGEGRLWDHSGGVVDADIQTADAKVGARESLLHGTAARPFSRDEFERPYWHGRHTPPAFNMLPSWPEAAFCSCPAPDSSLLYYQIYSAATTLAALTLAAILVNPMASRQRDGPSR